MMGTAVEVSMQQIDKTNWTGQLGVLSPEESNELIKAIKEL
jgi:uncharacterized coiled-coil DUF342 family protein